MPPKKRAANKPLTERERTEILRLHADGVSRNEICRRIGRSANAVTKTVQAAGGTFARAPEVRAALEAKVIDQKARRLAIVDRLYGRTEAVLDRLEADRYTYTLSGPDGPEEITARHPPAQDERNLANSISGYLGSAAKLEAVDADGGAGEAKSMLGSLAAGLQAAYNAMTEGAGDAP